MYIHRVRTYAVMILPRNSRPLDMDLKTANQLSAGRLRQLQHR